MSRSSYQYETSPRKYEPDYDIPRKRTQQTRSFTRSSSFTIALWKLSDKIKK